MVKLAMPTEDAHKDPCEQNLRLLQSRIESEFSNLVEARSEQGELDRIKSREINLIEVSAMFRCLHLLVCLTYKPQVENSVHFVVQSLLSC